MPDSSDSTSETDSGLTPEDQKRISNLKNDNYAESTLRTYRSQWGLFVDFCEDRDVDVPPADEDLVVAYLAARAEECAYKTVKNDRASIRWGHVKDGYEDPTNNQQVKKVMRGIKQRSHPDDRHGKRAPLMTEDLCAMVEALPLEKPGEGATSRDRASWLRALRDRALLLVGYASAFRGSELAAVKVEHIDKNENGIEIFAPDPKGDPKTVGVSYGNDPTFCPVRSLQKWLEVAEIESGGIFPQVFTSAKLGDSNMTYTSIWRRLKKLAKRAGIDPDQIGTHSLRRGHMTQAAMEGASLSRLQKQAGHKDPATTAEYIDDAQRMEQETSQDLGL
jgi:integrase